MVDDWPPVSPETYARLALLLAPEPQSTAITPTAPPAWTAPPMAA
ncbi:hypothetical protein AB0M23_21005 [Streptomyces sp. NPDC052077]